MFKSVFSLRCPVVSSSCALELGPDHIHTFTDHIDILHFYLVCVLQEKRGAFILVKLYLMPFP